VETFVAWAKKKISTKTKSATPAPAIDVLINNAGGAMGLDPVAVGKDEDWETMLQTNVLGLLRVPCCR
jgi:NADP-dependent 3-hydroxy acid dehydrogenase YdfG